MTGWRCQGYKAPRGAGASTRWHITSTDIHEASFPQLKIIIISSGFANAVSFHGFSPQDEEERPADIIIGGGAPEALKLCVQGALARALPSDVVVEIVAPGSHLAGDDEQNIVNRLALNSNGIQIEQNRRVREKHLRAIARRWHGYMVPDEYLPTEQKRVLFWSMPVPGSLRTNRSDGEPG